MLRILSIVILPLGYSPTEAEAKAAAARHIAEAGALRSI
jgi:hypothetical protein